MIGGDGINDESNKTAPLPLRNIARNITQRIGSPNACLLNLVLLYQRRFPTAQLRQHHDEQDDRHNRGQQIGDGLRGDYT